MKKLLVGILVLFSLSKFAHAGIEDEGVVREKTVVVHLSTTITMSAVTPAQFCMIRLASNTWPHQYLDPMDRGEIDISNIVVDMDKAAASTATVRLGVVTYTGPSTGTVNFFYNLNSSRNVSNTTNNPQVNPTQAFYRCKVYATPAASTNTYSTSGYTPFIATNETSTGSNLYYSSAPFNTPLVTNSTTTISQGDIVMEVWGSGIMNLLVDVWYHAEH